MKQENHKNRCPFTVPEGYFDNLEGSIMNMLPRTAHAPQKKALTLTFANRLRHIAYAATIAAVFFLGSYILFTTSNSKSETAATDDYYSNEYIDEMLNSYPIDDYTFYCYLTENY